MDPVRAKKLEAAKKILDEYQKRRHSPISASLHSNANNSHEPKDSEHSAGATLSENNVEAPGQMADGVIPNAFDAMHLSGNNWPGRNGESQPVNSDVNAAVASDYQTNGNGIVVGQLTTQLEHEIAARERLAQELTTLYESYSKLRNVYEWLLQEKHYPREVQRMCSDAEEACNSVNYAEILSVMVDDKSRLQSQLRQAMDMANALKQENISIEQELKRAIQSLEMSQTELRRAHDELRMWETRTGQLEEQLKSKDSELMQLNTIYQNTVEEKRELRYKLNVSEMENAKAAETVNSLKARISLQDGYPQAAQDGGPSREEKLAEIEEKFVVSERENRRLVEDVQQLRSENIYLRSLRDIEVQQLNETIRALQEEKDSLLVTKRDLEMDVLCLSSVVKNYQERAVVEPPVETPADNDPQKETHSSAQVDDTMAEQVAEIAKLKQVLVEKDEQLSSMKLEVAENAQCARDYRAVLKQLHNERATSGRAISQNVSLKGRLLELEKKFIEMSNANAELASELESAKRKLAHRSPDGCPAGGNARHCRFQSHSSSITDEMAVNPTPGEVHLQLNSREGEPFSVRSDKMDNSGPESELSSTQTDSGHPVGDTITTTTTTATTRDESYTEAETLTANGSEGSEESHSKAIESLKRHVKELQASLSKVVADNAELVSRNEHLDHLVVQLQSETETIGEFITLYRHQRQVIQQRLCEREEYTAQVCREKELMKEKVGQLRSLFTDLLLEVGVLKNYALPPPIIHMPFQSRPSQLDQGNADLNGVTSAEQAPMTTTSQGLPSASTVTEEAVEDVDGSNDAYSLAERINSLLMELQKPELSNKMPPRDPQLHCKHCIGRMITL